MFVLEVVTTVSPVPISVQMLVSTCLGTFHSIIASNPAWLPLEEEPHPDTFQIVVGTVLLHTVACSGAPTVLTLAIFQQM